MFEFDGVLFRTPVRPKWWPYNCYKDMIESLLPPAVPSVTDADWWNQEVVEQAKAAFQDPETWSVLITYRSDAFKRRVSGLLQHQGITFNEMRFRPLCPFLSELGATYTGSAGYGDLQRNLIATPQTPEDKHLLVVLGEIVSRSSCAMTEIDIWADHDQAVSLAGVSRGTQARDVRVHSLVASVPHASGSPTAAELQAMVLMQAYEKKISKKGNVIPASLMHGSSRTGSRFRRRPAGGLKTVAESKAKESAVKDGAKCGWKTPLVANVAAWPADIYAGRRNRAGWDKWDGWGRSNINFAKLCDNEFADNDSDYDEEQDVDVEIWEDRHLWELKSEDGEEEFSKATFMEDGAGWGWGGGIEFEWIDDADEVVSMANSCAGSMAERSEWSVAGDEVMSMCSGSVVGASDVMSVDSCWLDEGDWRAELEEPPEHGGRGVAACGSASETEETAAAPLERETAWEVPVLATAAALEAQEPRSLAEAAPYLAALLRSPPASTSGASLQQAARTCLRGRQRTVQRRSAATRREAMEEEEGGLELRFPIGGGWKKAGSRREARGRLQRMAAKGY